MNKKMILAALVCGVFSLCGCRTQVVTLDVIPADARVIANGVEYNNTSPMFIEAETGRQLMITAYKDGYREKIHVIDYELSTLGKIEACTAFLVIPVVGLFFDNAWTLKENNVTLTLEPLTPEAKREAELLAPRVIYTSPLPAKVDQTTDPEAKKMFNEME